MNESEDWRTISAEPDYEVSEFGRVRIAATGQLKVLQCRSRGKYLAAVIRRGGKRRYYKAHRLVAMAFLKNPLGLPEINHIDGNKYNNHVSNLEWCTPEHNIAEGHRLGLFGRKHGA